METKIYLVRHAQAEGNVKKFFQGRIDTELSERGCKQLGYLSERFKDINYDVLYSSPMKRAVATSEAVNKYHGIDIIKNESLVEIDGGAFEGTYWDELGEKYPEESYIWRNHIDKFQAPGGESFEDVFHRMAETVTAIAEENLGKTIVISSHGCSIRAFLCYAEFNDPSRVYDVGWADNTSVAYILYENGKFQVVYKNDVSHLPEELCSPVTNIWDNKESDKRRMKDEV